MVKCALISKGLAAALLVLGCAAQAADGMPAKASKPRVELGSSAAFAPDGSLLAVTVQGEHVMLYRSADEGRSWSAPVAVNAAPEPISADGENRPKLAFATDGGVLVSWVKPLGKPYSGAIRLARSDDGARFAAPLTVHKDSSEVTHRFETLLAAPGNAVYLAWIDKRDSEAAKANKAPWRGAGIYAAVSRDGGRTFQPETKVADHSCECCRVSSAIDADGTPLVMWRHVFAPNERDHALARLNPDASPASMQRATFERWKVDGCPHHGPSLVVDDRGIRHAVWFNLKDGEGRVHYGRLLSGTEIRIEGQRKIGGPRAAHADLAVAGNDLAIAWKEFDGERTQLKLLVSRDGGQSFDEQVLAATDGNSDQPRVIRRHDRLYVFWRTATENFRVFALL